MVMTDSLKTFSIYLYMIIAVACSIGMGLTLDNDILHALMQGLNVYNTPLLAKLANLFIITLVSLCTFLPFLVAFIIVITEKKEKEQFRVQQLQEWKKNKGLNQNL